MEDGYGVMLDILGDPKQVGDHHAFSLISLRRRLRILTSNSNSSLEMTGDAGDPNKIMLICHIIHR
jgi:hypothetical protein